MKDFRTLLSLVRPFWKRVVLAGVISLIVSGINAAIAWLVKPALDDVLIQKNFSMMILLPVAIILIFTFRGVFTFIHEYLMRSASQKMVMDLRNRLYDHIMHLPVGFFSKSSSGALISKVINDANALDSVISLTLKDLLIESATIISLAAVAFWRRWDLALIAIVVLPGAFYGAARLGKNLKQISKRAQQNISVITEILQESFTGVRIIKAFSREQMKLEHFKKNNRDYYRENMRSVRVTELVGLMMEVVTGLGIAFVLWYGGKLIVAGAITIGDFFSFLTAIILLFTPARRLAKVNAGIQKAHAPVQRIMEVLSISTEKDGHREIGEFRSEIRFDRVSFSYPSSRSRALNEVSLSIKKGELVAVVGMSGGGKTTLISMLPRFYIPDEGRILIDGADISDAALKSLRSLLGLVSQDVILFNDTLMENIRFGSRRATAEQVIEAAKAAYAHDFIMEFPEGYETVIGERGLRLSGGQRQRISIARAILKNPPILVLDEATSSLDTSSEMMIQNALEGLMKSRTTIVIAHRLSTVRKADRIVVMEKGSIIETGTHAELQARGGTYQKLYELQFRGQETVIEPEKADIAQKYL
ncbi:MAG: ABC transporter ATP-binding protein [Nitrospirae bacterium]|nr:ABC transporter ATP-binding protein [Nitrospirota bacterium]